VGPFPKAIDYYNDGSLYLIPSPGHLPGHVNILARTSPNDSWIYLAGDSAHNPCILKGCCEIAEYPDKDGSMTSAHEDLAAAKVHIQRVSEMRRDPRVLVILAHDFEWYEKNRQGPAFFPGRITMGQEKTA
jgi:glyoxylase-like metal-dependent hydrolase (beta-lactamase superfamily II)